MNGVWYNLWTDPVETCRRLTRFAVLKMRILRQETSLRRCICSFSQNIRQFIGNTIPFSSIPISVFCKFRARIIIMMKMICDSFQNSYFWNIVRVQRVPIQKYDGRFLIELPVGKAPRYDSRLTTFLAILLDPNFFLPRLAEGFCILSQRWRLVVVDIRSDSPKTAVK